jgi:hypothetical protein
MESESLCNLPPLAYPLVRLTKLRASDSPQCAAGIWGEYQLGGINQHVSLPVDYTLTGYLLGPVVVGQNAVILRVTRNDVPVLGQFVSTKVVALTDTGFITTNSVYRLEFLPPPDVGS